MNQKVMITGIFFILVFLFGFWLSHSGKPYNSLIFNLHKLIGLAMGIYLIVRVYKAHQIAAFSPIQVVSLAITVLIFVGLVAAGGLLSIDAAGDLGSIDQSIRTAITMTHKLLPYLAVLSTAGTFYLLMIYK